MELSEAQRKALERAAKHERASLMAGLAPGAAGEAVIRALDRKGLVDWDGPSPRIGTAGREAIAAPR